MSTAWAQNKNTQRSFYEGGLNGLFTISSNGDRVFFSQGNLQYKASTNTWRFAANQYDYIGDANSNISSTYSDYIDLFCWGTSGYNHGATCYQPWSTSTSYSDYYAYRSSTYNLFDQTGKADWGYNAISNGGNTENSDWRTLTHEEWLYLFNNRSTSTGIRYAKAQVNNVNGVILLPDDWNADYYALGNTNNGGAGYSSNVITAEQWATLEHRGAVFLPAAGYRYGTSINGVGSCGNYWSASYSNSGNAWYAYFDGGSLNTDGNGNRYYGPSVRLVRSSQDYSFGINAIPSPAEGGAVSGSGAYSAGAECTLTATPAAGYDFTYWFEEGCVVSTDATYTFTVLRDRNLVAHFVESGNISFADANVKTLCVANWDNDGDGELSYGEAVSVSSLGEVFENNNTITSFNELQYFNNLTAIDEQAFYGCTALTQVTIPENVTTIGDQAFWNCPALQTVTFNAVNCTFMQTNYNNNTYSVFSSDATGGAPSLTRVVIGPQVTRIPDYAFKGAVSVYQRLVISSSVTEIGQYAFYGCGLVQMLIQGNSLQNIGPYAFYGCSTLRSDLDLPDSVTTIGDGAFYGCTTIPSLNLGNGITSVGQAAFYNCSGITGDLVIPSSLTAIGSDAFYGCSSLSAVYYTGDLGQWCGIAFQNAASNPVSFLHNLYINNALVTTVSIPEGVTAIGQYAFYGCSGADGNLIIPHSVRSIGQYAFYGCSGLTGDLVIHNNMKFIAEDAFYGCSGLTGALTLPDALTIIGDYAFYGCTNLSELTIGEGVKIIGGYSFWNCPNLATVHFNATNCGLMNSNNQYSVFNSGTNNGGATPIVTLTIGDHVTNLPDYAFRNSSNAVGKLVLPESIGTVGSYAFYGCGGFTGQLVLPKNLTVINPYTFYGCSGFTGDLVLPNGVSAIGEYAFNGCDGFTGSLVFGNSVNSIGQNAFSNCTGFTGSLVFGNSVNSIGQNAFFNCNGFTSLIAEKVEPAPANNNSFNGMNFTIPAFVPYNTLSAYQSAAGWNRFTNYREQCVFDAIGMDSDDWSDPNNWYAGVLPTANDVVCINSNCQLDVDAEVLHLYVVNINDALTVNNGTTLTAANGIVTTQPSQLVIAEGGQVVNATNNTCCAVQRTITPYATGNEGWYSVAWPGMVVTISSNDDIYAYDETAHYWLNEKNEYHDFTAFSPAQGYLYANESEQTLLLGGYYVASNAEVTLPVTHTAHELPGLNLIGNPYPNNIHIGNVNINGVGLSSYYKAIGGSGFVAYTDADEDCFKPGDGFMVVVEEEGTLTFTPATRCESQGSYVRLVLSSEGQLCDRAYLSMNGNVLGKLKTHEGQSLLYFQQEGESYAIANNPAEAKLRFEPSTTATYTIEASLLNTPCEYLHLIDHLTDDDINLLEMPRYTFKASVDDPTDRFSLALSPEMTMADFVEGRDLDEHFMMPIHQVNDDQNAYYDGNALVVTATANVAQWGSVTGSGTYPRGATCTLTATANENGVFFLNWTENGKEVSTNPVYSFTLTDNCTLTANFFILPTGAVAGQFSVSNSQQIFFSQGNLQYIGSATTPYWKFADHQWDYFGNNTGQNSSSWKVDRDLFGWGTSGYNHGAVCYQPWSTSLSYSDYYAYGSGSYNLFDQTGQADWGFNAISNGGNLENCGWRTLTHEEWNYVFNTRNTTSGIRYAKANVNNVNGVILLPDHWSADYYTLNSTNAFNADFSSNTITSMQWNTLEQHGAVFLPAAGYRSRTSIYDVGSVGCYWSASFRANFVGVWHLLFNHSGLDAIMGNRYTCQSVRLVRVSQIYSFGINATSSTAEAGEVSGGGTYPEGADCTLTATANPGYVFVNWTKYGTVVSNNASLTFTVDENADYVANFVEEGDAITQTTALTQGWNWYSTYVEQNGIEGLEQMETSLGDNGVTIKSYNDGFVTNFGSFWAGSLTSVNNTSTYLIQTNAACEMTVTGNFTTPSAHPITLPTGWSWIGYPCASPMSVNTALAGLTPMEDDMLKSYQDGFVTYYPGVGWIGSLETITPGMGLKYHSHNTNTVTLVYPDASKSEPVTENGSTRNNHWIPDAEAYPDNMTVTAVVALDDNELQSEQYELAVFANNECRGSAKLRYIAPINRYVAFLTVYGEETEALHFGLYDAASGEEYFSTDNVLYFAVNGNVGSPRKPHSVCFRTTTGVEEMLGDVNVFPNPVKRGETFHVGMTAARPGEVRIVFVNALGAVVSTVSSTQSPLTVKAPDTAGVYTLRITMKGKGSCYRKLIVK